jgi:NAD(P)-dependent dehydrogenase (short-subunit alcohol dehydrogenase family)
MKDSVPLFSMRGRTVLVTGATGHLGRAMSVSLAEAGARVLVNGRSPSRVSALVDVIRASGGEAEPAAFDVTDASQVRAAISRVEGPLHAVVNNAYLGGGGNLRSAGLQAYRDSFEIGLVAAHGLLQESLPALRRAVDSDGDASVINIASMYGMVSPDPRIYDSPAASNPPFYGATKGALLQWTRYAACELGADGIRVNSVSPGAFPSDAVCESSPDFVSRLAARVPLGRTGRSVEIAGPVLFLASAASSYVNGANLVVDGGWTSW